MELVHVKCWILVLALSYVVCEKKPGFIGRARKTSFSNMSGANSRISPAASGQTDEFPNELRYTMTMDDEETVELHLVRDKFLHTPEMMSQEKDKPIRRRKSNLNVAFYRDTNGYGSFACVATTNSNGDFSCSLSALLNMNQETCFLPPGSSDADCGAIQDGEIQHFQEVYSDGHSSRELLGSAQVFGEEGRRRRAAESSNNETVSDRTKRSIFPDAGFKVVEVAYILDKAMMDYFYARNPGDNTAAEEEADLYVTLLTNEMNVYYSTIKDSSNGALDLYLFPAAVIYPVAGTDFSWVDDHSSSTIFFGTSSADNDIAAYTNGNEFTDKQWDHAMYLTGLNLYSGTTYDVLGYAYVATVCTTKSKRFSANEVNSYNIGRIGAHEIGHALSMGHDQSTSCPLNVNMMSPYIFSISASTKDTFYKFSTCSINDVVNHLSSYPSCVIDNGFTDTQFKEKFCSGLPGAQDNSLDLQCQDYTGWSGSTPCNTPTSASDCYTPYAISCSLQNGGCSSIRYVWQGTSCGTEKVCYKGDCVDSFDVCDATTTTTTTTTTSTTTTTTPTTTTTTPTTTTTTPTTTTTTPTTTTTTPTTTTTTPTTTTTTSTTTTTTSTTTTTTPTSTTTTTPTTTTTIPSAPCTCCGYGRKKKTKKCCKKGRRKHNRQSCYCCYELRNVFPGPDFDGPRY